MTTRMVHFLALWEIEQAVIFQKYEKSRSEIKNKVWLKRDSTCPKPN